jgi:hypothetical protein
MTTSTATTPKLSSTDNENYQMVPIPPGLLQYHVSKDSIIEMGAEIKKLKKTNGHYKQNFELECHTRENLLRLIPTTPTGLTNKDNWRILLLLRSAEGTEGNGGVCLKGALLNSATGEIALISSINAAIRAEYKHRTISSHDEEYKICQCKMIAPLLFWEELRNRLTN